MIKRTQQFLKVALTLMILSSLAISCTEDFTPSILIFSKTAGFRHESIPAGIEAIKKIGAKNGYVVDATEDASLIRDENLAKYQVVIFLSTTMDVLNKQQQNDFERFIQAGGGFVGIHAATDTEYDWPWYNQLVGAYFSSHPNNPNVRTAELYVEDANHISMDSIPNRFEVTDEFYNFKSIQADKINVLLKIDEDTYEGGTNEGNHPMSWYQAFDGGRSFYTALGHTNEMFVNPLFVIHLEGGIKYALGDNPKKVDYAKTSTQRVPDENRFTKVVLDEKLDEPIELAVLSDNRVLFVQRKGEIKLYDPNTNKTKLVYNLEVSHKYINKDSGRDEAEDGLMGLAIDPNFDQNNWIYLFHSLAGKKPVNVLSRWEFKDDTLLESSMKIMLEVEVQREQCCHTGGSIAFDAQGNLYVSTGDNTSPRSTAYAPIDEREGRSPWDAQKGSANTNDLRGKVLRIKPEADGTYSIPEGNLFPVGMEKTRPEIYGMGMRNPYRISVDQKTGYVYWGDVGPDASSDSVGIGPNGYDEINQLREPGFFGWPYIAGNNRAYNDYDFATEKTGPVFDPLRPVNESVNNTGMIILPPAQPAFIYYTYGASEEFPELGSGGRTAMAGPVFYRDMFSKAQRPFPDYYDGKLLIYEWMRGWIIAVTMDENGDYQEMERFMPSYKFSNPMDMEFGPDGDLYMLEYGTGWFQQNDNARLIKIEFNEGNRKPVINMMASKPKGAIPLNIDFSSEGTMDFDSDELTYSWKIKAVSGATLATFDEPNPSFTFDEVGNYIAILTVTDSKGAKTVEEIAIVAGNDPPVVGLDIAGGNSSFFFPNQVIRYKVTVSDLEDQEIADEQVAVSIDFLKEGFDQIEVAQGHVAADENLKYLAGKNLISESDCIACHKLSKASVGPMYLKIAKKYQDDPTAGDKLIKKVINGGSGSWGEVMMSAHPNLAVSDVAQMIEYILSLASEDEKVSLPLEGEYDMSDKDIIAGQGAVILRAAYTDKGANGMPGLTTQKTLTLDNPTVAADDAVEEDGVNRMVFGGRKLIIGQSSGAMIGFEPFDFTNITAFDFSVSSPAQYGFVGGQIEVRIDQLDGPVVGTSAFIEATPTGDQPKTKVEIEPVLGEHRMYVIYKNDNNPKGALFVLFDFTVLSE
ncbi:MAG: ThuA domain-containing protein [Reichenbachiella sp.]